MFDLMPPEDPFCRLDRRRQAIVSAARKLFIDKGYERATLGDIVQQAGGSLATIYKLFGNKDALLEAVVMENVVSGEALIQVAASLRVLPGEALHDLSKDLSALFLDPEVIALVRIVMARSISDPNFARRFFERTSISTRNALERLFEEWQQKGVAMEGSPPFLAEMFMAPFVCDLHTEAISHGPGITYAHGRLRDRTDFFLKAAGMMVDR
jgi:AcrR family transcriptional regulator